MRDYYDLTARGRALRMRQLAVVALEQYDLDVARIRLLAQDSNGLFRVDTAAGAPWVIRVGLGPPVGHSADEIRAEMTWMTALTRDTDLQVPRPLPNSRGDLVTTRHVPGVPEPRHCVVFSWLRGRPIDDDLSPPTMHRLGALSARLHEHAASFRPGPGFEAPRYDRIFPYDQPVELFDDRHRDLMAPRRLAVFREAHDRVGEAIARLQGAEHPRVIHGDLHRWNVMKYRGRLAPFDFEDLLWGWPTQDIAITLYYQWGEDRFDELNRAFRKGYETVAAWPERVEGEIATFIAGRNLVLANDVLTQPEWRGEAAALLERGERRIRDVLQI